MLHTLPLFQRQARAGILRNLRFESSVADPRDLPQKTFGRYAGQPGPWCCGPASREQAPYPTSVFVMEERTSDRSRLPVPPSLRAEIDGGEAGHAPRHQGDRLLTGKHKARTDQPEVSALRRDVRPRFALAGFRGDRPWDQWTGQRSARVADERLAEQAAFSSPPCSRGTQLIGCRRQAVQRLRRNPDLRAGVRPAWGPVGSRG